MPKIVASIEARMGSSRLPGKVLADVNGQPALSRLLNRLRRSEKIDEIVLATSVAPADDLLEQWAKTENVAVYRGSEEDVLQRVVDAHRQMNSDIIVEVTGDCTLLDPQLVDMGVETFLNNPCDVVCNVKDLSFPMGMDIQVFRFKDLEQVALTIDDPAVREHVSLYFYEHPEQYRILNLYAPKRWFGPDYRFMLDYPEDLQFINEIYRRLEPDFGDAFGLEEIMALLSRVPQLLAINIHCEEKAVR